MQGEGRLLHLEALRGLAAIIVLVHHLLLGFAPGAAGFLIQDRSDSSLFGSPFFFIVNGLGAVTFFFVLSGYVLPRSFLRSGNVKALLSMASRRFPRLLLPVALSILFSWALFETGAYAYVEAAGISGSGWLADFGFAGVGSFEPSLLEALRQSGAVFFVGSSNFNAVLWTMRPELFCSFVCLAGGAVALAVGNSRVRILFLAIALALAMFLYPFAVPFILGTALAVWDSGKIIPTGATVALSVAGLLLLSYVEPIGAFSILAPLNLAPDAYIYVNGIGATMLIAAASSNRYVHVILGGRFGEILGKMSFPLYLVHMPVLASAGAHIYIWTSDLGWDAKTVFATTSVATALLSAIVALPLVLIEVRWLLFLRRWI